MDATGPVTSLAFTNVPVPMAIVSVEPSESLIEVNHAFARLVDRDPAELHGIPLGEVVSEPDIAQRTPLTAETAVVHLIDRQPVDLTPRWLRAIVDNSAALVYVKSLDGRYLFVNRRFERNIGLDREQVVGRTDLEIFPVAPAVVYAKHDRQVLATGEAMEVEEPAERDDRSWLSIKFPLTDERGRAYALGGISTDITDRKRAEAVAAEARYDAERANQAKSVFLSRVSHELRTPLNAILGFGQLLALESLPEPAQVSVERIVRAGRHMLTLINEVLELTRIEAGGDSFAVEPVDASGPLVEAFELIRPLAHERGIELSYDAHGGIDRYCLADRQRLTQALLNLLSNAVKYNRPGGIVRVVFRVTPGRLRYLVTDTGPGLDSDACERVFVPFERLTADGSEIEGTGLGLSLSKSLIEGMGGALGIQHSAPGEGSTFYIELPLCDEPEQRVAESLTDAPIVWDLPASKVLYVEDNLSNLELVRGILAHAPNVELIPALQGQIAVDLAAQHRPDVILLDLNLPDLDGDEVLRRLRRDDRTATIPIVVLSADATPASVQRLQGEGIAGYLTKPLDIPMFVATLRAAVTG